MPNISASYFKSHNLRSLPYIGDSDADIFEDNVDNQYGFAVGLDSVGLLQGKLAGLLKGR